MEIKWRYLPHSMVLKINFFIHINILIIFYMPYMLVPLFVLWLSWHLLCHYHLQQQQLYQINLKNILRSNSWYVHKKWEVYKVMNRGNGWLEKTSGHHFKGNHFSCCTSPIANILHPQLHRTSWTIYTLACNSQIHNFEPKLFEHQLS